MNGGVAVFCHHTLTDQDRIFEVVAVPRHERHQHVLTDGDFAQIGRRTISNHIALGQLIALLDDGALVDVGVLVGALVLDEVVDIHTDFTGLRLRVVDADHHAGCIDVVNQTATRCHDHGTRVDSRHALNTGTHHGLFRTQHRHGLTRHVRTHQRAVGIVVLQERNQRCGHRHDLCGGHVHVLHALGADQDGFAFFTGGHQVSGQHAVFV